ncbi:hypothetical protein [uncultured Phenylobacterium sp.]|uniref:hypothetical protein n=1 Tax=uncultured Phenylobacterium sp. TaxID=349273 RepID=UPI0025F85141|nr:hypothetical protein [uncultured Phenylobacterium sp.]
MMVMGGTRLIVVGRLVSSIAVVTVPGVIGMMIFVGLGKREWHGMLVGDLSRVLDAID